MRGNSAAIEKSDDTRQPVNGEQVHVIPVRWLQRIYIEGADGNL